MKVVPMKTKLNALKEWMKVRHRRICHISCGYDDCERLGKKAFKSVRTLHVSISFHFAWKRLKVKIVNEIWEKDT